MAYSRGTYAYAICDVCGFRCRYRELRPQVRESRATGNMVCPDCVDKDRPRDRAVMSDPQNLWRPRPDTSLEASRRIPHWKPTDALVLDVTLGEFEVITNAD